MSPAMIATGMAIVKGVFGLNTRDKYEEKTGKARPLALSRRAINSTVAMASVFIAGLLGFDVPEVAITGVLASGGALVDLFTQNKILLITAWSSVTTLIGYFKRKKKGQK